MLGLLIAASVASGSPGVCNIHRQGAAYGEAAGEPWTQRDRIVFAGRKYHKYGSLRTRLPDEIRPATSYRGANVYVDADAPTGKPEVIYVLHAANQDSRNVAVNGDVECLYQPYILEVQNP